MGRPTAPKPGSRYASISKEKKTLNFHCQTKLCFYLQLLLLCDGRQEIKKLLKEQEELHQNLAVCKNSSRQCRDIEDTQSLQVLLEQRDKIEEEMETEKRCQKQLEAEVD